MYFNSAKIALASTKAKKIEDGTYQEVKDIVKFLSQKEKKFYNYDIKNNNIIFLPYLNYGGSISPFFNINSKAEIFGLLPHHNNDDILFACYQGLSLSIKDCYDALNIKIKSLFLSGGASKSIIFPQILADVLGIKINVPSGEEFGARGAAYIASVAVNKFPNLNQAVKTNKKPGLITTCSSFSKKTVTPYDCIAAIKTVP